MRAFFLLKWANTDVISTHPRKCNPGECKCGFGVYTNIGVNKSYDKQSLDFRMKTHKCRKIHKYTNYYNKS